MKPKIIKVTVDGKEIEVIEMRDGKPVYIDDAGKEIAFDAAHTTETIERLQKEAKGHRLSKEEAETKLKAFDGIEDPDAARKALKTVANLNDKDLVDADKVEQVKNEAIKAVEEKYAPVVAERDQLKSALNSEMIGGRFGRSKFIADKIAVPADMIEAQFGKNFSIVDGKVVAKDAHGNQIYSKERPGEPADFEEALEILVNGYAHKDNILKGSGGNGSGAPGGGNQQLQNGKTAMTRADFDNLSPAEKATVMSEGKTQIVDNAA